MSTQMNREIRSQTPDGAPPDANTDIRSRQGNDPDYEPDLMKAPSEGELLSMASIPIIKLPDRVQKYLFEAKFDCTIPEIHKSSSVDPGIPLLRLQSGSFTMNRVALDDRIPSIPEQAEQNGHFNVPIVKIQQSAPVYHSSRTECTSDVPEHWVTTYATLRKQASIEREIVEEPAETLSPELSPGEGSSIPEESPDITHCLFGVRNDVLSTRQPKIILYKELPDDNTLASFETFCLCAYREQVGGNPTFRPINRLDETIETYLEKWANPGQHLITLDLDYSNPEAIKKWLKPENLRDFIERSAVADYGFVIFKSRKEDLFENFRQLIQEQLAHEIGHPLDILVVNPNRLSIDKKRQASSIFWGNCAQREEEPQIIFHYNQGKGCEEPEISSHDLDVVFNKKCRREYEEEFSSFTKGENRLYQVVTKRRGRESEEHYLMKCYVVRYLAKKHKLTTIAEIEDNIKTEYSQELISNTIIPDIFDEKNREYYEIETLFAGDRNGKDLINHLSETVRKYGSNRSDNNPARVYVVIDSIAAVRHMSDLLWLEETFRNQEAVPVKFLTFDIASKGLIPIQEVKQKLQKMTHDQALMSISGTA